MQVSKSLTEYYSNRPKDIQVSALIIHCTENTDIAYCDRVYRGEDPDLQVSPHYMIKPNGEIIQYVEEENAAWHAGDSYWDCVSGLNLTSIGIELINEGEPGLCMPYPEKQIEALILLAQGIVSRHKISNNNILGHSDVSPGRKLDPGRHFPWRQLAASGLGIWPNAKEIHNSDGDLVKTLHQIGYNPAVPDFTLIREFQRHYESDIFMNGLPGIPSDQTLKLAKAVLAEKN